MKNKIEEQEWPNTIVAINITTEDNHCSNSCPYIVHRLGDNKNTTYCRLFNNGLKTDKRYKNTIESNYSNEFLAGYKYKRLPECRDAESEYRKSNYDGD